MPDELVPVGSSTAALAVKNASVNDEIGRAGASFGDLILTTGKAVAETQKRLNETGADTATQLATTLVDVIAVQEKIYDDHGTVIDKVSHMQHLPLVNFIDPVFYQWSQVRLQGLFYAGEFATAGSTTSVNGSFNTSAAINFIGVQGVATGRVNASEVKNDSDSDISYGNVRMNALLEPRTDIGVPKPTQVIQGPRLSIILAPLAEIKDPNNPNVVTARTMDVLIQYQTREINPNTLAPDPIPNKPISIEAPGLLWSFTGPDKTDASGDLRIQLRREFSDPKADTSMKDFVVTARIGILQNATTVNL